MSADDGGPGRREVAHRLFAAEFDDATVSYAESDEERAPKYVVTPTGARVNRMFAVGVLTEVESVNEDVLRARVVDYTGAFVSYAGQYQPDAAAFFERHRSGEPTFVALTGKARTFEPDDGDRIYSSVRPETVAEVDAETRDRWTVSAAEATLRRVAAMADARSMDERGAALRSALEARGYDESLAAGVAVALDRYGTTTAYLDAVRRLALDALEVVAGERDAVRSLETAPDAAGTTSIGPLPSSVTTAGGEDGPEASPPETEDSAAEPSRTGPDESSTGVETAGESPPTDEPTSTVDVEESGEPTPADGPPTSSEPAGAETSPDEAAAGSDTAESATAGATGESSDAETAMDETADPPDAETATGDVTPEPSDEEDGVGTPPAGGESGPATDPDGASGASEGGLGDFEEDDLYELDEEERREVEESFDVGFESGAEVDDPGEAGIDVPGPEDLEEADGERGSPTDEPEQAPATDEPEQAPATDETTQAASVDEADAAGDVDLESVAVETIDALDEGDGADREAVVATIVADHDVEPEAVADAIEDALLSGQCYEPTEDRLKAI